MTVSSFPGGVHVQTVAKGRSLRLGGHGSPGIPIDSPIRTLSDRCIGAESSGGSTTEGHSLLFRRVATSSGPGATETVEGIVRSQVATMTENENEVQRFSVQLLRQPTGGLRQRGNDETESAYRKYLTEESGSVVAGELHVEADDEGNYPFGAPGVFKFEDVPLLQPASEGGFTAAQYTILVTNGQTDEFVLDDLDEIVPDQTTELYFSRGVVPNVIPGAPVPTIELEPLDSIPAKQTLVVRLSEFCEINYKSAELPLVSYLEQLRSGSLDLTETRNEGLRRGVWAERVVIGAGVLADQLYDRALAGLGTVLADAFDDLSDFSSRKLSAAKKRLERIKNSGGVPAGFKAGNVPKRLSDRIINDNTMVKTSEMAGLTAASAKALKPLVVAALTKAGAAESTVEAMADNLTLLTVTVLSAVKSGNLAGATKPLIKKAIEATVAASKPLFLDSSDTIASSYCQVTRDDLAFSAAQTQSWSSFDPANYRADRTKVVETITRMNTSASSALIKVDYLLGTASGLDAGQDALSVVGVAVKQAAVAEKAVQAIKYLTNIQALVEALVEIYAELPVAVNQGVHQAFGQAPTLPRLPSERSHSGVQRSAQPRGTLNAPNTIPYFQTLDALRDAIQIDDIGTAIDVAADDTPEALPAIRAAWRQALEGILLRALAAPDSAISWNLDEHFGVVNELRLDTLLMELELWERIGELAEGVLAGDYTGTDDPTYQIQKSRTLSAILILRTQLAAMLTPMNTLVSRLNGADPGAAVLVTFETQLSQDTGGETITLSPEPFTVTARVQNLSGESIGALTAQLEVVCAQDSVTIVGPSAVAVGAGSLSANDNTDGGSDEAEVSWTISYQGDFTGEVIALAVNLLEDGAAPISFLSSAAETFLLLDPDAADTDLDLMPDSFESEFGLDTTRDDSQEDPDEDGANNLAELRNHTFPDEPDSDEDGLKDGEELSRGVDGAVTDPRDADSDDDGVNDAEDGAPNDAGSTQATPFGGEPEIQIDRSLVALGQGNTFAEIEVANAGAGTLLWSATVDRPDVVSLVPNLGTVNYEGGALLTLAAGYLLIEGHTETVTLTFTDEAGQTRDTSKVRVIVGATAGGANCGDANDSGGPEIAHLTAGDALLALQASVGIGACEPCRCDVDASGRLTAGDALAILRKAVGLDVLLVCPPCV